MVCDLQCDAETMEIHTCPSSGDGKMEGHPTSWAGSCAVLIRQQNAKLTRRSTDEELCHPTLFFFNNTRYRHQSIHAAQVSCSYATIGETKPALCLLCDAHTMQEMMCMLKYVTECPYHAVDHAHAPEIKATLDDRCFQSEEVRATMGDSCSRAMKSIPWNASMHNGHLCIYARCIPWNASIPHDTV
eukprot:1162108-Pelagomonas_calceolata.AAC.9